MQNTTDIKNLSHGNIHRHVNTIFAIDFFLEVLEGSSRKLLFSTDDLAQLVILHFKLSKKDHPSVLVLSQYQNSPIIYNIQIQDLDSD